MDPWWDVMAAGFAGLGLGLGLVIGAVVARALRRYLRDEDDDRGGRR